MQPTMQLMPQGRVRITSKRESKIQAQLKRLQALKAKREGKR